tara:strand:+ start:871 stop:1344 length:474 start_codon:yes stop_codon:yes gene_type:complete
MPFNSTKVDTTSKIITTTGGNFEGMNIFNGSTASVVYICDNILAPEVQVSTYNNDPTVTVENSALLTVGDLVTGNGIPADTKVLSITDGTTIELTASTTGGSLNGPLAFEPLDNTLCKFHIAADSTYFYRGFEIVCRKGIKVVATDWSNLEVFTLHN